MSPSAFTPSTNPPWAAIAPSTSPVADTAWTSRDAVTGPTIRPGAYGSQLPSPGYSGYSGSGVSVQTPPPPARTHQTSPPLAVTEPRMCRPADTPTIPLPAVTGPTMSRPAEMPLP